MHGSCYAAATTGINVNKSVISLLKQTDNDLSYDDESELMRKLQGIKNLKM